MKCDENNLISSNILTLCTLLTVALIKHLKIFNVAKKIKAQLLSNLIAYLQQK